MHINEHSSIIMPSRLIRNLYYSVSLKTNETQANMVVFGYIVYNLARTLSRY
jgi:hypothetical protein